MQISLPGPTHCSGYLLCVLIQWFWNEVECHCTWTIRMLLSVEEETPAVVEECRLCIKPWQPALSVSLCGITAGPVSGASITPTRTFTENRCLWGDVNPHWTDACAGLLMLDLAMLWRVIPDWCANSMNGRGGGGLWRIRGALLQKTLTELHSLGVGLALTARVRVRVLLFLSVADQNLQIVSCSELATGRWVLLKTCRNFIGMCSAKHAARIRKFHKAYSPVSFISEQKLDTHITVYAELRHGYTWEGRVLCRKRCSSDAVAALVRQRSVRGPLFT
jgi:hypothetical protein